MKCNACFKELNKKEVVYTEDKTPYCVNPFTCNEHHPNSVPNIVARGGAVRMFTEDELETNVFEKFDVSPEIKERVMKIANKPQSIRLSKFEIAHYLIWLQETKGLSSISEAVRHCVKVAMEVEPVDPNAAVVESTPVESPDVPYDYTELTQVQPEEPSTPIKSENGGIKFVVTGGQKQTARDLVMKQIEESNKEQEEEFTF